MRAPSQRVVFVLFMFFVGGGFAWLWLHLGYLAADKERAVSLPERLFPQAIVGAAIGAAAFAYVGDWFASKVCKQRNDFLAGAIASVLSSVALAIVLLKYDADNHAALSIEAAIAYFLLAGLILVPVFLIAVVIFFAGRKLFERTGTRQFLT